ncbi:MAG: OmpA family protein [Chlorobiota bacterium]
MKRITKIIALFIMSFAFASSQNVIVSPLNVNSDSDDFSSGLTVRGNEMYFTSEKPGEQKIFRAVYENGDWKIVQTAGDKVNSGEQNGAPTLTPDGQYMVFASYENDVDGEGRTDLYSARKIDGKWSDIQNLGIAINSEYWDSQPSISSDGMTLYFSSDRPASKSGTNIFYSKRTREGWSQAKELESVNSNSDEMSPFIAPDNKTFTMSSNRSGGEGGFDIYVAKVNSSMNTYDFKNAGSAINTEYDEHFYTIAVNTDMAFFSSNKPAGKDGYNIYSAVPNPHLADNVVFVHGKVTDAITSLPLGSNISIYDLENGDLVANLNSDDITGEYSVVLTANRNYSITAEKEGYLFYSENFNIPKEIKTKDIEKDISLSPLKEGKTRLLIFFDFDKSSLKDESKPELTRLVRFLNSHPDVKIELHGHTDSSGDEDYNQKLSQDRANSVRQYLYDNGIQSGRIGTKGFGESMPLVKQDTESANAMNRRVELVIVSK